MSKRTIAIGDIHGCDAALETLLQAIDIKPGDTLVTLGDYIDRGPDSRSVVQRLLELRNGCELVSLMGNHEMMLLGALESEDDAAFWLECGGAATLASYGDDLQNIPQDHIDFFEQCALAYETDSHIFVHACYYPGVPINEQDDFVLLWQHLPAKLPAPHVSGKTVVVGHSPQTSGDVLDVGHLVCIDTWCFGDGWLTAFDVESRNIWQASNAGELRVANSRDT